MQTTLRKSRAGGKARRAPVGVLAILGAVTSAVQAEDDSWTFYGHNAGGQRFSVLNQINAANEMRI